MLRKTLASRLENCKHFRRKRAKNCLFWTKGNDFYWPVGFFATLAIVYGRQRKRLLTEITALFARRSRQGWHSADTH